MSDDPDVTALRHATERLGEAAARIREGDAGPEELRTLADEALTLGAEITERVPRTLRPSDQV